MEKAQIISSELGKDELFLDKPIKLAERNLPENQSQIVFAAGCFWGVEAAFFRIYGVIDTLAGYAGGTASNPNYMRVSRGNTGHAESVLVTYDKNKISLSELLDIFFIVHNPTSLNRQGPDVGSQYRSAVFYYDDAQFPDIKAKVTEYQAYCRKPIVTEIQKIDTFYPAEEYHQDYIAKHGPSDFCSGFQHNDEFWRMKLPPERYLILRGRATEEPFSGEYADFWEHGLYRCAGCGLTLFSSDAKFKDDKGWVSFNDAIEGAVVTRLDLSRIIPRKEAICSLCLSHLGHVFRDNAQETGKWYCINSLALIFNKRY